MRCISPFDNGSYHMGKIRTNGTNRQLGQGFLGIQRVRNILSPPDEMHFSIRQRVDCIKWARFVRVEQINNSDKGFLAYSRLEISQVPLMRCISPFDNGSYDMGTIRTNRTNRQLGERFLGIQRVRNILSPPNEMHFSSRQRVVSTNVLLVRIDDSIASAQPFYDSYLFRCIGQPNII